MYGNGLNGVEKEWTGNVEVSRRINDIIHV